MLDASPAETTTVPETPAPASTPATPAAPAPSAGESSAAAPAESADSIYDKYVGDDEGTPKEDEPSTETVEAPTGKARGPDGKFVSTKPEAQKNDSSPSEAAGEEAEPEGEGQEAPVNLPATWAKDKQEAWAKLPRDVQSYIAEQQEQIKTGFSRLANAKGQAEQAVKQTQELFDPFLNVARQHADWFKNNNIHPADVLSSYMIFQRQFESDPAAAILSLMQQAKIDPTEFALRPPKPLDAEKAKLMQRAYAAEAAIKAQEAQRKWEEEQTQTAGHSQAVEGVAQFATDKPYWDVIAGDVNALIPGLWQAYPNATPRQILQEAHDRALMANPTTRRALQQADSERANAAQKERAETEAKAKAKETARQRVADAQRAASINVQGSPTSATYADWNTGADAILAQHGIT